MQVAGILARTPPLPLGIDHCSYGRITAQEEENLLFALQHRDRVRVIRLEMQTPDLKKLIMAMSGEFPMLECLVITPTITSTPHASFILPATFQAPRLRRLRLSNPAPPIVPPSLTTPTGLVELSLVWDHPLPTPARARCSNGFRPFIAWRCSRSDSTPLFTRITTEKLRGNCRMR